MIGWGVESPFPFADPSMMLDVGVGVGVVSPGESPGVGPVDPRREYVAADFPMLGYEWGGAFLGEGAYRRWHSALEYERMLDSPAAGSSFNALRAAVLQGGVTVLPAVEPKEDDDAATIAEAALAATVADSNRRTLASWKTPVIEVLHEAMLAIVFGHKLAEPVADDIVGGPDDGKLAVRSVKFKPRSSYRFRVDRAMNVIEIGARAVDEDGGVAWKYFKPDKFAWLSWDSHNGDPRGLSAFRMAVPAFRRLEHLWPEIMEGWRQFGRPMLWGNTGPAGPMVPSLDKNGKPIPGGPAVTREYAMSMAMQRMRAGSCAAGPDGSGILVVESAKDATVVSGAIGVLEGQQIRSILLQLRATVESKFGSRADSETGQDIMGTLIKYIGAWLEGWLRAIFVRQNTWNYGPEVAERLTPRFSLGDTEHQDWAAKVGAFATLFQSGGVTLTGMQEFYSTIGWTIPKVGDLLVTPNGVVKLAVAIAPAIEPGPSDPPKPSTTGVAA